ncbi:MAG: hypothetical protein M3Z30_00325 [Gemmatimonadota bacterium]|nr:hypothetical protein [Gemmatimonadota bacterium]
MACIIPDALRRFVTVTLQEYPPSSSPQAWIHGASRWFVIVTLQEWHPSSSPQAWIHGASH